MRRVRNASLVIAGLFVPVCSGQALWDAVNFKAGRVGGIHLLGVSAYSGYSTRAFPQGGLSLNNGTGLGSLGADTSYGVSASLGWQRHREKADVSVFYSGTYGGMLRYSDLNSFGQSISLSVNRALTSKWSLSVSASGNDSTLAQYLFEPSNLGLITQLPLSFDDLAAALSAGQFTSSQVASMLTGSPIVQSAGRSLLLGNRVLTYSTQANLSYAVSSRLQLHFGGFTAAGQSRTGGHDNVPPLTYVMPRSVGGNAGIGFTYSLSPRTDVGANVEATRTVNHFQSVYATTATAFVGRKMGEHWFLNVHGGASYGVVTEQLLGAPRTRQMVGGGSLGFQTGMHTLVGSYERAGSDTFGFAVGTVTSYSAAWNWHHAGSRWSVFSSFGEQQTRNTGFTSLSGAQASAGISTSLNSHTSLTMQYAYMNSTGSYLGTPSNLKVQSIRVSLGWAPQGIDR